MKPFAAAAIVVALASAASAQEKVKLELKAKKGDKIAVTSTESNTGKMNITFGGQEIVQEVKEKEVRKYKDEVLEVEGIVPVKVRRAHSEWSESKTPPGAEEAVKTSKELEGKTIILKKAGDATEYEGAQNIPEAELRKNRIRPDALLASLPKTAVAVGETWALDGKTLKEEFQEGGEEGLELEKLEGVGKLEKIEDHKGQRCGVVLLTIDGKGNLKGQKSIGMDLKIKAKIWIAIESGRALTLDGDGSAKIAGEFEQDGNKIKIDGALAFKMEGERTYE